MENASTAFEGNAQTRRAERVEKENNGTGSVSVIEGPALAGNTQNCFNGNDVSVVRGNTDSYVYIDSDGDGNFNSSLDQTICLKNTLDVDENNVLFTNKLIS